MVHFVYSSVALTRFRLATFSLKAWFCARWPGDDLLMWGPRRPYISGSMRIFGGGLPVGIQLCGDIPVGIRIVEVHTGMYLHVRVTSHGACAFWYVELAATFTYKPIHKDRGKTYWYVTWCYYDILVPYRYVFWCWCVPVAFRTEFMIAWGVLWLGICSSG